MMIFMVTSTDSVEKEGQTSRPEGVLVNII